VSVLILCLFIGFKVAAVLARRGENLQEGNECGID
jgi:hypothetical protein